MNTVKAFLLLLLISSVPVQLFSQKIFVRDYQYRASDTDSKVSSRQKALIEVRSLLVNELGVYIESYVNYEVQEEDNKITKDFFENEIRTISAGVTETKILEESWNGYEYFIKAEMQADPDEVLTRINQTLSKRRSNKVIDSLQVQLSSSLEEIEIKSNELKEVEQQLTEQRREVDQKEKSLEGLKDQLNNAKRELKNYQAEERVIVTELEKIENQIENSAKRAVENVRLFMTPTEVKRVAGNPRSTETCAGNLRYNYGSVWTIFESGVVKGVVDARDFINCRSVNNYTRDAKFILK